MTALGRSEVDRGLAVRSAIANHSLDRVSSHNRQLLVYLMSKVAGTREASVTSERKSGAVEDSKEAQENNVESSAI
jgi:hypothetical protein